MPPSSPSTAPASPAQPAKPPARRLSYEQVLSLGYEHGDYFVFDISCPDGDGPPITATWWLLGFRDERGREPDFCYLSCEGFPSKGQVLPVPFAEQERRYRERIDVGTFVVPGEPESSGGRGGRPK